MTPNLNPFRVTWMQRIQVNAHVNVFSLSLCVFVHKMSVKLCSASGPEGNNASLQGTTVGGSKPLHRFIKGQPKIVGFILCGILYILTEHKPTKKTVTISLAVSVVTILGAFWTVLQILPEVLLANFLTHYDIHEDSSTETDDAAWSACYEAMGAMMEVIYLFYSLVGAIIFIVMSSLAGAALRSTKSQAIIVMTTAPTETPVE
ncbi:uncharacterized protein LOC120788954 isoform X3 [Xiphias gladius]|uniref:uncharacterized protein LOC120788954 isoform X3 n=1 Tax=Xiphias gladius TaxID=8245 RepID=UPI001A99BA64|nr:uncharacterized protein LOC120788954 isoform X3 [Xiphias gladius]